MTSSTGAKEKILVAMSGGVDSSVAAALAVAQGFEPIGLTMLMHRASDHDGVCGNWEAVDAASAVAQKLGMAHETLECPDAFEEKVLRPSWEDYRGGRTPSPCLLCNRVIKFEYLLQRAVEIGARWIATGHYVQVMRDQDGNPEIRRAVDRNKDQSYFLARLTSDQLSRVRFPLGGMTKPEVRELARELGLANAERAESQDACLETGDIGFAETLRRRFEQAEEPGSIVTPAGDILGQHQGIHKFTVGQRKGIGVAFGRRAYVVKLDAAKRAVVVSDNPQDVEAQQVWGTDLSWLGATPPPGERRVEAQIRYRHRAVPALARWDNQGQIHVKFDAPQRAVAPGQGLVLYEGDRVLAGAWIDRTA